MRGRLLILIGIILALVSGFLVFKMLSTKPAKEEVPKKIETKKVVVAVQNLSPNTQIVPEAVTIMEKPVDEVPEGALISISQTRGKYTAVEIFQGDIITKEMLKSYEEIVSERPAHLVPTGMVAFTIKVNELSSVAYNIQPGDLVDVLVSFALMDVDQDTQIIKTGPEGEEQTPRYVTQLTLQRVKVLDVGLREYPPVPGAGEGEAPPPEQAPAEGEEAASTTYAYDYITLLLPQQDALVLKYLRETRAKIDLALRNPEDTAPISTEAVTLEYIMRRFNIPVPPKLPYVSRIETGGFAGE